MQLPEVSPLQHVPALEAELLCPSNAIGSVLAKAEDALAKFLVVSIMHELQVASVDEGEACPYGISPRASPCTSSLQEVLSIYRSEFITKVVALVFQIMPKL
jgi:hypothetical protein